MTYSERRSTPPVRPTKRSSAVPGETQLLAALQFFASGSFQWVIGLSCVMSQSSVSRSINAVTVDTAVAARISVSPRGEGGGGSGSHEDGGYLFNNIVPVKFTENGKIA